ncbi:MAG TPA: hypothetical protein VFT04_11350 [Gemmatimonadales bacterium]|nr:hypothetical protein [Gemmatimonadales bacterium]
MITRTSAALSHALVFCGALAGVAGPTEAQTPLPPVRREFPLNCRGGAGLVFDTLLVVADSDRVRLMLTFAANATASGPEGQGLEPGSCAWVDRPLSDAEPRRIQFALGTTDSAPARTVRDSGMYWGFLGLTTDSGYIAGVGYRHWHASSPPRPNASPTLAAASAQAATQAPSRRSFPLPFDVRYLPLFMIGIGAIIAAPSIVLMGRWSGWRRLAERYPDRNASRGTSLRSGQLVMNKSLYKMGVRFTLDESHLHVTMSMLARPGHQPFSVPWSDIAASRDEWPWFPFKGEPMVRLTFAAYPEIRVLVRMPVGLRLAEASGGRLWIDGMREPAAAGS